MTTHTQNRRGTAQEPFDHEGLLETPTDLVTLSPEFLQALREVAPKTATRTMPYFLALIVVVGAGLAAGRVIVPRRPAALPPSASGAAASPTTVASESAAAAPTPPTIAAADLPPASAWTPEKTPKPPKNPKHRVPR